MENRVRQAEVIIVGGGLAGLSAAVYLGRALRSVIVVDSGKSMARWEPHVQNYLGFPKGIGGPELLTRAREHAREYGAKIVTDEIFEASLRGARFNLKGKKNFYSSDRLLIATGIYHLPPDLPGLNACLGHSMFFCKDCDGYRVQGRKVAIYGWTDEAIEYALGLLVYTSRVVVLTNGHKPKWDKRLDKFVKEYHLPVHTMALTDVEHEAGHIKLIHLGENLVLEVEALFTTRGDIYYNKIAKSLGAKTDKSGEIIVDAEHRTSVRGLFAAGCVTPANCQMIIAAGDGAGAAQAINRDLFETSLETHALRRLRQRQVRTSKTAPRIKRKVFG